MATPERTQAPQPQKALKYRYDAFIEEWSSEECVVMIARKPFAEGGMRWCYKMYEIDQSGKHAPGVAKTFKDDAVEEDDDEDIAKAYFDEAMTQTVADSFAQQFNQVIGDDDEHEKLKCRFLPVRVMQFYGKTGKRALCNCEPYLQGSYVKHNDNDGNVETALEVPQAFSHFTWEYSNQLILVCDIQGVDNYFTDPQIHSHDGNSFGMGNLGQEGIDRFLETHKCNSLCRQLGLETPQKNPDGSWMCSSSLAKSKITVNSFKSSPADSKTSRWTARKYDDALEAITRATKRKGSGKDGDAASTLTQQQLSVLQAKLTMLIQQHGSMNQLLLSPQRLPRKAAPQADIKNRPWSPERSRSPRRAVRGAERSPSPRSMNRPRSPIERVGSPLGGGGVGRKSSPERSSYGKISSSYAPVSRAANSFSEYETAAKSGAGPAGNDRPSSWLADVRGSSQNKLSSPIAPDDSAGKRSPKAWAQPGMLKAASGSPAHFQQQSSPCVLGGHGKSQLEAMCKYCRLTGSVEQVLATGPQHDTACKRWGISHPAKAKDGIENTAVADRSALSGSEGLSETDQKKKEMLHKQMLILKKQLEEQLQRLQTKANTDGAGAVAGPNAAKKSDRYDRP